MSGKCPSETEVFDAEQSQARFVAWSPAQKSSATRGRFRTEPAAARTRPPIQASRSLPTSRLLRTEMNRGVADERTPRGEATPSRSVGRAMEGPARRSDLRNSYEPLYSNSVPGGPILLECIRWVGTQRSGWFCRFGLLEGLASDLMPLASSFSKCLRNHLGALWYFVRHDNESSP
jgi:hypothetical protein